MPEGVLEIILAIDQKNVLSVNAARILLNIRTPQDIIENQDSRIQILDLLEEEAAKRLAAYLGLSIGTNVYDVLKNIKGKFLISYNDSEDAKRLFRCRRKWRDRRRDRLQESEQR